MLLEQKIIALLDLPAEPAKTPGEALHDFCRLRPRLRLIVRPTYKSMGSHIRAISVRDIRVLCFRPLPPGSRVAFQWHYGPQRQWRTLLARVAAVAPQPGGTWEVHCTFETPLTENELASMLPQME